jgi:hypothetical protein
MICYPIIILIHLFPSNISIYLSLCYFHSPLCPLTKITHKTKTISKMSIPLYNGPIPVYQNSNPISQDAKKTKYKHHIIPQ